MVALTGIFNGISNGSGGAGLNGEVTINGVTFSYTGSIADYTIPTTGLYDIAAIGANASNGIPLRSHIAPLSVDSTTAVA